MREYWAEILGDVVELGLTFLVFYIWLPEVVETLTYATSINPRYDAINTVAPVVIYLLAILVIILIRLYNENQAKRWFRATLCIFLFLTLLSMFFYNRNINLIPTRDSPLQFQSYFLKYWGVTFLLFILPKFIQKVIKQLKNTGNEV